MDVTSKTALALLTSLAITACGSEPVPPAVAPGDGGTDYDAMLSYDATIVPPDAPAADTAIPPPTDAQVTQPTAVCPPPMPAGVLPMLSGRVLHTGGEGASTPPAMTGGTVSGTYGATLATVYLPAGLAGIVDAEASTVAGTAWFQFDGVGHYSFYLDVQGSIVTTLLGTQMLGLADSSVGTYSILGATITLTPECLESAEANGQTVAGLSLSVEFSASGTTGQVLYRVPSDFGEILALIDVSQI